MRAEVLRACRQLLQPGDTVVCGFSGGADSTALLHCLVSLQEELSICVSAAHYNHGLRGEESDRDEAFVRAFCEARRIPLTVGRGDVRAFQEKEGLTLEEAARKMRYDFLESLPCDKIAVAHNADDNAETVLLHLVRGSGLRGLCGIPPVRGRIVRPLLTVSREEIVSYLKEEGLSWVEDSTNASCDCTRNRLRHEVLPLLKQENPNLLSCITAQSGLLRGEDALLDSQAEKLIVPQGTGFLCAPLVNAPDPLEKRALRLILRDWLPQDVAYTHICALQELLRSSSPSAKLSLPGGLTARRSYEAFEILRETPLTFSPVTLQIPGKTRIAPLNLKIICEITENYGFFKNTPFHFALKYDMIVRNINRVRPRRTGDRLTLNCGKSLKKLFIDRRIPRWERDLIPVFVSGDTVAAVPGIGVDRAFLPAEGQPAIIVTIKKEDSR